ncbi:NAD(P)-dependent oxidoreductase [Streptomyces sp. CoH27]|uniref:NAD-dependent epimerase/dehydratase family protein n=1 Tax=Streptomyces sp. CoH27 TaxID=2875763 RepID=UPI001CD6BE2C|nr:NAD(P)-dependent oxidoreductase [Streptomyces sp. CoH27]
MRRVVVLGGSGFLGRHICRALAAGAWDVLSVGRRVDGVAGIRTVRVDLSGPDAGGLAALLARERPAVVVNAAGAVWGATDEQMTALNAVLVERLIEMSAGLPLRARLVQIGSLHELSLTGPHESASAEPATVYARTKARATQSVRAAAGAGAIEAVVLRVSNTLGAGAPAGSLLGGITDRLAAAARWGEPCRLELPPLTAHRDFVDARDVADAVVRACAGPAACGQVLEVGRGEAMSVRELIDDLIEVSAVPTTVTVHSPKARAVAARSSSLGEQHADISAIRELLGWQARFTPHDGLVSMWRAAFP